MESGDEVYEDEITSPSDERDRPDEIDEGELGTPAGAMAGLQEIARGEDRLDGDLAERVICRIVKHGTRKHLLVRRGRCS